LYSVLSFECQIKNHKYNGWENAIKFRGMENTLLRAVNFLHIEHILGSRKRIWT